MFTLLSGTDKKAQKEVAQSSGSSNLEKVKELFGNGKFPVVTTQVFEGRPIAKVLGLVCCRGFDSEDTFFGMAAMAMKKGAQGIIGYSENVAFHPDGSKYFSCFGTAVMFAREARNDLLNLSSDNLEISKRLAGQYSADTATPGTMSEPLSEDEDPVLQRLLASQRRTPNSEWQ